MQASQLDYRVRFLGLAVVLLVASSKTSFLVFLRFPPRKKIEESPSRIGILQSCPIMPAEVQFTVQAKKGKGLNTINEYKA